MLGVDPLQAGPGAQQGAWRSEQDHCRSSASQVVKRVSLPVGIPVVGHTVHTPPTPEGVHSWQLGLT